MNQNMHSSTFQFEKGAKKGKIHIQGIFTLDQKRTSKTSVLILFAGTFENVKGLTLSPTHSSVASRNYVTKEEGRVSGPYLCGTSDKYDTEFAQMKLSNWQQTLYKALCSPEALPLRKRNVITVHDSKGKSGKSQFVKWLRVGQKQLVARKLPIASVQQLNSAVYLITKDLDVDIFMIDITRSQGKDQTFQDLFSSLEDIVNGYVVDVMFGKYHETVFKPPQIIIFTNYSFGDIHKYMSDDRWIPLGIGIDKQLKLINHNEGNVLGYSEFTELKPKESSEGPIPEHFSRVLDKRKSRQ
jgi:hypothetical protein